MVVQLAQSGQIVLYNFMNYIVLNKTCDHTWENPLVGKELLLYFLHRVMPLSKANPTVSLCNKCFFIFVCSVHALTTISAHKQ